MPSKKVLAILIVCISLIGSAWLISSTPSLEEIKNSQKETVINNVSASAYKQLTDDKNEDWKKLLNTVDTKNQQVEKVIKTDEDSFEETSITAKLSKDLMSKYLALKGSGKTITPEDLNSITGSVLNNPEYTTSKGAKYITSNLKIISGEDPDSIITYKAGIKAIGKKAFSHLKEDPYITIAKTMQSSSPDQLRALDPIIEGIKLAIKELLNISVPKEAVVLHLNFLNSFSKILTDLESIRLLFDDPVKSLSGIKQYDDDKLEFMKNINEMSEYVQKN